MKAVWLEILAGVPVFARCIIALVIFMLAAIMMWIYAACA